MNSTLLSVTLAALSCGVAGAAQQTSQLATIEPSFMAQIKLRYASFDPMVGMPEVPQTMRSSAGQNLVIVQFNGKPTQAGRDAVTANGGELIGYLPDNAYLVRIQPEGALALQGSDLVRWTGAYHPAFRLQPELLDSEAIDDPTPARYNIVVANKRTDKPGLMQKITSLGGVIEDEHEGGLLIEATLTGAQLLATAAMDEVLWIDLWSAPELDMDNARIQGGGNYVEAQAGYTGAGVNAHIYEGIQAEHPDFTGPVINVQSSGDAQTHGHATAGIVFGNGMSNPAVRGMAPDAGKFYTTFTSTTASRYAIVEELVNVHNVSHTTASWGGQRTFFYEAASAEADDIVFDHDVLWTQSQSNAGNQDSRPEAWAKNIMSIGAVRHGNNANPADDSWSGGGSTGPASDGRIKPTLCAYFDATGTSDRTGASGYSAGDWTANFGGTSGATPMVAGHNVLAIQMFTDEVLPGQGIFGNLLRVPGGTAHENRPHFTTLKALQVVNARQYAFTASSSDNRREHQGWGFPNLQDMWDAREKTLIVDETEVLLQGESRFVSANVGVGEPALKVCLNWNEPAGNPAASSQLINDLSLRVTSPDGSQVFWGNHNLEDGVWSTTGGSEDHVNSLECVFVQSPMPGEWPIEVMATTVVQDNHVETSQIDADYGLVVVGGQSGFISAICQGVVNSTGSAAVMEIAGSAVLSDMDLTVAVNQLPLNTMGYFITSDQPGFVMNPGGSQGNLCIAGPNLGRYSGDVLNSGSSGSVFFTIDLTAIPTASGTVAAMVGDVRCFQYWYRDSLIGIPVSNFSGASCLIFQ